MTDVDGKFTLALDKPTATLVVSYIGYLTKEVPVGSQPVLKIILSEDTQNLEEVVVIGYGSVKKSDLTGAVGSIQVDKVQGISVKSVDQMLQDVRPVCIWCEFRNGRCKFYCPYSWR